MPRVGIALGSNLGDRLSNIRAAIRELRQISAPAEPLLKASVWQTEPKLCPPDSPMFLNTVVEIGHEGEPFSLLEITKAIEKRLGREAAAERNAPRVIDVDLLYFGDRIIDTEELALPHPRIIERRFVLQPLAEIRPHLILPGQHADIATLLAGLESEEAPLVRHKG
ncbi:MAG: 2-amino-4-hydroxy-6-hydroxymethyldihydropteridine diphosphokinase [Verrucomicrobiaceae bacterium]|nr:MAG: 2-amino-4-hydroxy-6-hydroxymethyldihydropteridine diphosphokinase [Verrucomicrobiaceae bacterium]